MHKKHMFLRVFSKTTIFACVFCAFFVSPVFANLPASYTELEYIESTGTQYIDTGLINTDIKKITFTYEIPNDTNVNDINFYGVITGASGYATASFVCDSTQVRALWSANKCSVSATKLQGKHTIIQEISPATLYIDNNLQTLSSDTGNTKTGNLTLFASMYNTTAKYGKMKLYFCDIETVNTSKRNFIPARRNSDNKVGLYDTVTNTFFTNSGTGDFIAGPVVEIKIATTKMVDEEFAAAEAKLATTVQTIESVVSRTITQTGQIQILQDTKQTRPDESCPANMKCLLVQDEDGTPHWYPIIEP